jgi:monoamine oxidase
MAHTPTFRKLIRILQQCRSQNFNVQEQTSSTIKEQIPASWKRRRLLKTAAFAMGGATFTSTLSYSQRAWSRERFARGLKIAVIGGGIAGLNAAYQLKKMGLNATIYEARRQLGGRIQSVTGAVGANLVSDLGGHFINSNHEDMLALAEEFGLSLFNRTEDAQRFAFPEVGFYFDGRILSESEIAEALRPLAMQISHDAELLDTDYDQFAPMFDEISVADYLIKHADKITQPFIRKLIENTIRTEYGVEPEQSSALQLLFNLPTVDGNQVEVLGGSDEALVVEGGSGQIINKLAIALSGQIQTGMYLRKIQSRRNGFRLTFFPRQIVDADYVIIAIPFTALRHVDIELDLPYKLRRFINEVNLGFNEKIFAGFNQKIWRQENGFVQEIWTDIGFSSAWDGTQRQTNRNDGALTFFFGGREVKAALFGNSYLQGKKFVNRFDDIISGAKKAANGRFLSTQWTKNPLTQGAYTNFQPGQLTKFADFFYIESDDPSERQDVHVGNLIFAGEQLSDEFYGFMNGGAQTGRLAAEVLIRNI